MDTLSDVLSFVPIVDFNAGVVAAGEAQIESTVIGNDGGALSTTMMLYSDANDDVVVEDAEYALRDRGQIYLPINNAITDSGHVHGFLSEIGQGVQHVASRVKDIVDFVQRANDNRKRFGEGFAFLNIPRSYYGTLTVDTLVTGVSSARQRRESGTARSANDAGGAFLSADCAAAVRDTCASGGLLHDDSSLVLDATGDAIRTIIDSGIPPEHREEYLVKRDGIVETILHSRYVNLYNLLRVR